MGEHDLAHRIIWRLAIYHKVESGASYWIVTISCDGNDVKRSLRPDDPRKCLIDLRAGDAYLSSGKRLVVERIEADGHSLLTAGSAASFPASLDGYVYQLPAAQGVPQQGGECMGHLVKRPGVEPDP